MDNNNLLTKLSQSLLEILNDNEYCDVNVEAGSNLGEPKTFRAHMVILNYRSPYLRRLLSKNKKKDDENFARISIPTIQADTFQIILRYIYGGTLSLKEFDISSIVDILITADKLDLQELISHIQFFLIENTESWIKNNFDLICRTSFESDSFLELQRLCASLFDSDKIFNMLDLSSIPEKILISMIQNSNLKMSQMQIWTYVLKWGFSRNPGLPSNPADFSKDHFITLKDTLQQFIPFIGFCSLSSKEFMDNVFPYRNILPEDLLTNLLNTYVKSETCYNNEPYGKSEPCKNIESSGSKSENYKNIESTKTCNQIESNSESETYKNIESSGSNGNSENCNQIELSNDPETCKSIGSDDKSVTCNDIESSDYKSVTRKSTSKTCIEVDSNIITPQQADLISKWIDRIDISNNQNSTYEFKLILRGTRDGFSTNKFHEICDDQPRTVTIMKVKDTNEILGGYNPIKWDPDEDDDDYYYYDDDDDDDEDIKNNFIFSFKCDKNNINYILSRVIDKKCPTLNTPSTAAYFCEDLVMWGKDFYDQSYCKQTSYEKPIRETEKEFSIEEYEVFEIIKLT
ncbi:hypothetical protein RhiirA1_450750 [Rhizophagus irregularis]|uniref:Kelch-like protein 17 n=1 Tax=Rhizophagus irregularis TaxID=588596 RepID=A0A2N0SE04_9GLOM|nr:hypothetical protein RhiirA1_450750 [Rhizophagus irregularis]